MALAALTLADIRRLEDDINSTLTAISNCPLNEGDAMDFMYRYRVTIATLLTHMQDLLDEQNDKRRRYLC